MVDKLNNELTNLIVQTVNADSWQENGGRHGYIRLWASSLVVVQTESAHEQIAALLNELRESEGLRQGVQGGETPRGGE